MTILDTNVVSELMRSQPEEMVLKWLDAQPRVSLWTTSITLLEVWFGLQLLPLGKRRSLLLEGFEDLLNGISHRVLPFDTTAARHTSDLMAARQKSGQIRELRDSMIAGIALANHGTLATRNTSHFKDTSISLVNPWLHLPGKRT